MKEYKELVKEGCDKYVEEFKELYDSELKIFEGGIDFGDGMKNRLN